MMLLGERKTGVHVTGEKLISWSKGENQQQTQPTLALMPTFETGPHWWEGEGSHQCTIPYSILNNKLFNEVFLIIYGIIKVEVSMIRPAEGRG